MLFYRKKSMVRPAKGKDIARLVNVDRLAKIYGVLYNQPSSVAFDETSSYWSMPKSS